MVNEMSVDVDDNIKRQVKEIFQHMKNQVTAKLFVDKEKCLTCAQTKEIIELLAELAPENMIKIELFNKEENPPEIKKYNIERFPTIILHGKEEQSKLSEFPASQILPARPLPPVCSSAKTTRPSLEILPAYSPATSLVLAVD